MERFSLKPERLGDAGVPIVKGGDGRVDGVVWRGLGSREAE